MSDTPTIREILLPGRREPEDGLRIRGPAWVSRVVKALLKAILRRRYGVGR